MGNEGLIPDAAIVAFLVSKGVSAHPPTFSEFSEFINRAAFAANPVAGGLNYVAESQKKSADQAEWHSWKQWALVHADWPAWYENDWPRLLPEIERLNFERMEREEVVRREARKMHWIRFRRMMTVMFGSIVVCLAVGLLIEGMDQKRKQSEAVRQAKIELIRRQEIEKLCKDMFDSSGKYYRSKADFNNSHKMWNCNL